MRHYAKWLYLLIPIVVFFGWLNYYKVGFEVKNPHLYRFLILEKNEKIDAAWVLFYYYPKNYVYLLEVAPNTKVRTSTGQRFESFFLTEEKVKANLSQLYDLNYFDEEIVVNRTTATSLLRQFGGTPYFNRYSTNLSFGEVYINELNYSNFLQGIEEPPHRHDDRLGIWLNLLGGFVDRIPSAKFIPSFIKILHQEVDFSFNLPTLEAFVKPLVDGDRIMDKLYFSYDRLNLEEEQRADGKKVWVPFQRGRYDKTKLAKKIGYILGESWRDNIAPVSLQIKNHTKVNRLAAKATGYFRLRRFDVVEYVGSNLLLPRSLILDFSYNPKKRKHLTKASKIDVIYYMFNYRENYDYALYLGEDFFGAVDEPKKVKKR